MTGADVKSLTSNGNDLSSLTPAFERYNEKQLATVKLPGASKEVIVSEFNKLEANRYFDVESQTSFEVDHITQVGAIVAGWPGNADGCRKLRMRSPMRWNRRIRI